MALIKLKPTSPGTRFVLRVDKSKLWKGGPLESLTTSQSKKGGRNSYGRITTRHKGGGSRQKYRLIDVRLFGSALGLMGVMRRKMSS